MSNFFLETVIIRDPRIFAHIFKGRPCASVIKGPVKFRVWCDEVRDGQWQDRLTFEEAKPGKGEWIEENILG